MKRALGLMSGTSMDGIDVAMIETDGEMQVERGPAMTLPYPPEQRALLLEAVRHGQLCTHKTHRPGMLAAAEQQVTELNAAAVAAFLRKNAIERNSIDIVGFHGQTVLHRPEQQLTVQLGNGPLLAELIRRPVVFDLRAADVAAGGQGAPLVPVYHRALAARIVERPIAFLNLGGVGNLTWIGEDNRLAAFDTGPGNALLDDWTLQSTGELFDRDGVLAGSGTVHEDIVADYLSYPYFARPPPKSLDRNDFKLDLVRHLSVADGAATLARLTAEAVARSQHWLKFAPKLWIVCGGGRHNSVLMRELASRLTGSVATAESGGLDGDSVEAEAWAYLAVRAERGLAITYPETTGVARPITGGVLAAFDATG